MISPIFASPLLIALISSALCGFALSLIEPPATARGKNALQRSGLHKSTLDRNFDKKVPVRPTHTITTKLAAKKRELVSVSLATLTVTAIVLFWTNSLVISAPFTFFSGVITWIYLKRATAKTKRALDNVWPEVIDHLISGIHAGLSLSEAMVGLAIRGPEVTREAFLQFSNDLRSGSDFASAAEKLKANFNSHSSDQILEAILLAKSLGGSELLQIFRTLGDFLRQDLALRKEIEIKHGWIMSSAHMSSAAPWLLLLLLSSQPGTAEAFAQPGGIAILLAGIASTVAAYFWMGRLSRLPQTPRVFG